MHRPSAFFAGAITVLASYLAALWLTGVDGQTLARWSAALLLGWLLPGLVVVRIVRPPSFSLLDQVAWATPAGLVVVLLGWATSRATGLPLPAWVVGVVATGLCVGFPATRRRLLRGSAPGWGWPASVVVVASLVVAVGWAVTAGLAAIPVTPDVEGFAYSPDSMFQVAMAGELGRTARPTYPMVAGESLSYHWFCYAAAAQLGLGLDTVTVMLRLFPLALLLATILMVAALARQACGGRLGPAAGALGAALSGLIGNTQATAWIWPTGIVGRYDGDGGALEPLRHYWQHSPTTTFGWVVGLATTGLLLGALRQQQRWWFVVIFAAGVMSAGAKASVPPVLVCGSLAVTAVAVLGRDRTLAIRGLLSAVVLVAAYLAAVRFVYGGGNYGLRIQPGFRASTLATQFGGSTQDGLSFWLVAIPTALTVYLLPTVPRLLGLFWLTRRRPKDPAGWLLAGAVVAGYVAMQLVGHPGHGEIFFLVSAYPLGLAGSAAGLAVLAELVLRRTPRRTVLTSLGLAMSVVLTGAAVVVAGGGSAAPARGAFGAWLEPMVWLLVIEAVALAAAVLWWRRSCPMFGLTAVAGLLVVGLIPTCLAIVSVRDAGARREARVEEASRRGLAVSTPELVEASAVISQRARPTDIIASNRVCYLTRQRMTRRGCDPRDFTVAAFSGLRTDVTGWAYADRVVSSWTVSISYRQSQFWDPARLAAEEALIRDPTSSVVTAKWDEGVRWVLADQSAGRVSTDLETFGTVEYRQGTIVVVRLHDPHQ